MQLSDITDATRGALRSAGSYVSGLTAPTIRLGVTGLARSGKTVFITAFVRNLIEGGRLPFFLPAAQGRILRAYLEPQPDDDVPRFAYEDHLAMLGADPPLWPRSTSRVSQLRVTIEFAPKTMLRRALGTNLCHVDIVDYPGEWLLDLPLLDLGHSDWSRGALELAGHASRAVHAEPFFAFLAGLDKDAAQCEQQALKGAQLFTAYLKAARADDHALSIAGPGRFLMPGDLQGSPLLTFFPMVPGDTDGDSGRSPKNPLAAMLTRRFESYKSHVVKPFFRDHFVRLDRQIVLVDALAALNGGPAALDDLRQALKAVLMSFRPGTKSWLSAIWSRRIDRLLFAATKADHLHHTSHDRLEGVLRLLTETAMDRAALAGAEVKVIALAALRATREVDVGQDGEILHCIFGTPLPGERLGDQIFDGVEKIAVFPGDLPADPAQALEKGRPAPPGDAPDMRFMRFRPPRLGIADLDGAPTALPHIRLDRALDFLLGDRLQ